MAFVNQMGQKVMIPFIYKSTDNMMIQMLKQKHAGYSDENGNIQIFNDTTRDLSLHLADHAKTGAFSTFKISAIQANFLKCRSVCLCHRLHRRRDMDGRRRPLIDIAEELIPLSWQCVPVPQFDPEQPPDDSQGPSGACSTSPIRRRCWVLGCSPSIC